MPEKARKGAGFERRRKHEKANITKVDISYRATLAHLESMFGHDRFPARIVQLLAGLCLYGVSMAMMVHADLGLDPWNVLHQGLSPRIGLSRSEEHTSELQSLMRISYA